MIVFPNCKINLGLTVKRKRPDGYHDIETVFYPVPVLDCLEIIPTKNSFSFTTSGDPVDETEDNLCLKALRLLQRERHVPENVNMHLHKAIPTGAGLGGGSSDASFTLLLLNQLFHLDLSQQQLLSFAMQLGSDCPFFIINESCFATGRGDVLTRLPLSLSGYMLQIVYPGVHISTGALFQLVQPQEKNDPDIPHILQQPVATWKQLLKNDFEPIVARRYPAIAGIIASMYRHGALYAALTGTGSAVFGIYPQGFHQPETSGNHWRRWICLP